jgi:serine/threonine protein kinase
MKIVRTSRINKENDENMEKFQKEVNLLSRLENKFIIKYYESFQHDSDNFCIITEFCDVGIFSYLHR